MRDCPKRRGNADFVQISVALDGDSYESAGVLMISSLETE